MKELVFATHNRHKLREVQQMMPPGLTLLSLGDIGCREAIPETAETLEGNARIKAMHVWQQYGYDCFADDTGLEVPSLGGAPGVFSARYAGPEADAAANMEKLLGRMQGAAERSARFRTVIALVIQGEIRYFEGIVKGEILRQPAGSGGFGYDPLFRPEGFQKSFAQMPLEEKNRISHRGKAFTQLRSFLNKSAPDEPLIG